jgi:hypothetical protein
MIEKAGHGRKEKRSALGRESLSAGWPPRATLRKMAVSLAGAAGTNPCDALRTADGAPGALRGLFGHAREQGLGSKAQIPVKRRFIMSLIARVVALGVLLMLLAVVTVPANAQTSSVPVKVVNAKDAVQLFFVVDQVDGELSKLSASFTVPAGKRFVVEHISGLARMLENQRPAEVEFNTTVNGKTALNSLLFVEQSSGGATAHTFVANHMVQIYADPGTTIQVYFLRNFSSGGATLFVTMNGYLVPIP